jgi:hypothetical protein
MAECRPLTDMLVVLRLRYQPPVLELHARGDRAPVHRAHTVHGPAPSGLLPCMRRGRRSPAL